MLLLLSVFLSSVTDALQVIGGNVTVSYGRDAVLPCKLVETSESLTQISWQKKTRQQPVNDNFCTILQDGPRFFNGGRERFTFVGDFKDKNGSLQLSEVTLSDEGTYTCIFTLFPSGNHKTEIPLNVFVAPVSSLQDLRPALGQEEVPLVICTAAGSKPPAEVSWITGGLPVRATTNTTHHANGTTTTVSSLLGVPTLRLNQETVQCVVTTEALKGGTETLTHVLQVYFSPTDVKIEAQDKGSFECVTEANPSAEFKWSRLDDSWPRSGVKVDGAKLQFLSMTAEQSGLYQCDASNTGGTKRGYLYVHVPSGSCSLCWTLFSLLLLLLICAAAGFYLYKTERCSWISRITDGDRQAVPTNSSSPHEDEGRRAESEGL